MIPDIFTEVLGKWLAEKLTGKKGKRPVYNKKKKFKALNWKRKQV